MLQLIINEDKLNKFIENIVKNVMEYDQNVLKIIWSILIRKIYTR
jgi:hypothetical protein